VHSIAVLPFVNATSHPDDDYLSDGITEDLINSLSQLPDMKVVARSTAFRFKGSAEDPAKIGQQLKVDAVLTGRITERNGELSIQTDLINTTDATEIWGSQYSRSMPNLMTLRGDIAGDVATKLKAKVSGQQHEAMTKAATQNSEAYQLYLKGRYYWNKRGPDNIATSIDLFKQAVATDPSYALAYAGLADAYSVAPAYTGMASQQANALAMPAARKAVELDPQLAEAHGALAAALVSAFKWTEADKEFQRALELAPNDAHLHYFHGFIYLLPMGKVEPALAEFRNALALDPLAPITNANYAFTLSVAHRYEDALQQFRRCLEIDPAFGACHLKFSRLCAATGKWAEAVKEYVAFSGDAGLPAISPTARGYSELVQADLALRDKRGHASETWWALAFATGGDRERAITWLQKAAESHDSEFPYEIRDPVFDFLRSDARYVELMGRVGLPP
jgi:TolB-like protein/tetratricopeptide (TPR) repeat protein